MMNRNLHLSFSDAGLSVSGTGDAEAPAQASEKTVRLGGLRLFASVCGNVLVGSALLGGLMLAPHLLAFVLGMV